MLVTQKEQYALRAIFELAKRKGEGPVKISEIADSQAIPSRFLEVILSQLKRKGIVESKRGYYGGYCLIPSPENITVAQVLRSVRKTKKAIECISCLSKNTCPFDGNCAFMPLWNDVQDAISRIYESTTIDDLIKNESRFKSIASGTARDFYLKNACNVA